VCSADLTPRWEDWPMITAVWADHSNANGGIVRRGPPPTRNRPQSQFPARSLTPVRILARPALSAGGAFFVETVATCRKCSLTDRLDGQPLSAMEATGRPHWRNSF